MFAGSPTFIAPSLPPPSAMPAPREGGTKSRAGEARSVLALGASATADGGRQMLAGGVLNINPKADSRHGGTWWLVARESGRWHVGRRPHCVRPSVQTCRLATGSAGRKFIPASCRPTMVPLSSVEVFVNVLSYLHIRGCRGL